MRFSVLLLVWPLAEIATFILVGGWIGVLPTLALIVLTAVVGVALLRRMGLRRWPRDPLRAAASGGMTLLAAVLLILPGLLTDVLGLVLLLPPVQVLVAAWLAQRMVWHDGPASRRSDVIDGEFIEVDADHPVPRRPRSPSDWTRH